MVEVKRTPFYRNPLIVVLFLLVGLPILFVCTGLLTAKGII